MPAHFPTLSSFVFISFLVFCAGFGGEFSLWPAVGLLHFVNSFAQCELRGRGARDHHIFWVPSALRRDL